MYRIDIQNRSEKKIVLIVWEVSFINPITGEIAGRHEFVSPSLIAPNARKTLSVASYSPPTGTVDINLLRMNRDKPYQELVKIKSLTFANGSRRLYGEDTEYQYLSWF